MKSAPLSLVFGAAFLLAGCADRNPLAPAGSAPAEPSLQRLECAARVGDATLVCGSGPGLPGAARSIVVGGQSQFVRIISANVSYDSATRTFAADVRVQNLLDQAMGTADGATADPAGIRVFFHSGPSVTAGAGIVRVSNADGEDAFTAAAQPFFRYPGILPPGDTSAAKRWTWTVEPTVKVFGFTLFVHTRLAPALVIDEIMAHPTTADEAAGEWFELYNKGRDPVDLDGWTIASGGDAGYTIHGRLVIGRGEYLVLGGSADAAANGGAHVHHAWTDVRLGNDTGDWLALRSPGGVAVDSVDWGAAPGETASPPPEGVSLAFYPPAGDNLHLSGSGSGWVRAVNVFGTGQRGSPGARNLPGISLVTLQAGGFHNCGLDAAGQAWCWGYNAFGQTGTGGSGFTGTWMLTRPAAAVQPGGRAFVGIGLSLARSCGLDGSGQVYCWIINSNLVTVPTPIPLPDGVRLARLWGGPGPVICGQARDGALWCWGGLPFGLAAAPEVQFSSVAIGDQHLCGLSAMGQAYCAGTNDRGELGDGTRDNRDGLVAVHQPAGVAFAKIGAGARLTCAIATSGVAYCWGGTEPERWTPVAVSQPDDVVFTDISVGSDHACALASSGQVYCWGGNANGELGDSTTTFRSTPTPVRQPPSVLFSAVTTGRRHTCALERATGQPYCWGDNILGELGDGTTVDRLVPVAVVGT